jgi:hypothetical protein
MQLVLAMAMAAAPMAQAQQATVQPAVADSGDAMQATYVAQSIGVAFKDDLFAGTEKFAKGATDVSEINLDPKTMGLVRGDYAGGMAHRMKFMVIRSYTYDKPGMYNMDDVEVYRKKLNDGAWSCSIHVRNKDGATDICSRSASDGSSEMVIISAEPKELSFIHMSGNVSLGEMERSGGSAADFNLDLNHSSDAAAKAKANAKAEAKTRAEVEAQVRAEVEAQVRAAEAQTRAADAQARVAAKKSRTFRMGSITYSSGSSTPAPPVTPAPSVTPAPPVPPATPPASGTPSK